MEKNKDKFIFTADLTLIRPYSDDICIETFISSFENKDIIVHFKTFSFCTKNP